MRTKEAGVILNKDIMENIKVTNNEQEMQFETVVGDDKAVMVYRWYHGDLAIMHTGVPEAGRGKGYSNALAEYAITFARERNIKLKVYCTFMQSYMKRRPEHNDLISTK
jgi:predicted GNAT family acetyltransferase